MRRKIDRPASRLAAALATCCVVLVGSGPALAESPLTLTINTQATLVQPIDGAEFKFFDTATLSGASGSPAPTGTVTFNVYGPIIYPSTPSSSSCAGTPVYTSTNTLSAEGTSVASNTFEPVGSGPHPAEIYLFTADYSGDTHYAPATSECNATGETVSVPFVAEAITEEPPQPLLPPIAPPGGGSGTPTVTLSRFGFSPTAFAVAGSANVGKRPRQRSKLGTRVSFVLSAKSMVSIAVSKVVLGSKFAGKGCVPNVATTQKMRVRHPTCKTSRVVGALMRSGSAGSNTFYFAGRLGSRILTAGAYRATATVLHAPYTPPSGASTAFRVMP